MHLEPVPARSHRPHGKGRESMMLVPENSPVVLGDPGVWYVTERKLSPQNELMSQEMDTQIKTLLCSSEAEISTAFPLGRYLNKKTTIPMAQK